MNAVKRISLGMAMQVLVMIMHLFIHFIQLPDINHEERVQIICSFIAVIFITYLTTLFLKLPVYVIITAQIVTVLFILIFEDEGAYLLYYLHKGNSQWFNPNIFTDTVIIVLEMLVIQLPSAAFAKLTKYVYTKNHE